MKFTPKVGKKDKSKKTKKNNKVSSTENNNKKVSKKSISTKNPNNEVQQNKSKSMNLDTRHNENDINTNTVKTNENIKSITVNTISNKNSITSPIKNNKENNVSITSIKSAISPTTNKKSSIEKSKITNSEKTKQNKVLEQKVSSKNNKLTELKNNKKIIEIDEDSISEVSDDYVRTIELKDSIEDSSNEADHNDKLIKKNIPEKLRDNEDRTLVEDVDISNSQNTDKLENEPSSEIADETLIIEDSERILETSDEEMRTKENNGKTSKLTKRDQTKVIENEDNNNQIENNNKDIGKGKDTTDSIYDLLDQEEFNQSIDTEIYNNPINHNDKEIENIVHERIIPKRKVGRPPKKPRGRKITKKPVEVIVISDDEDSNDGKINETNKKTVIKKEDENELPIKIKQEVDEVEQTLKNNSKEVVARTSKKRLNREIEVDENEQTLRKMKKSKTSKKLNNEIQNEDNNDDENIEHENQDQELEEETVRIHEKEKKAKKAKSAKTKTSSSKSSKVTKSSKKSKTTNTTTSETEEENSNNESAIESSPKKKTKKRKNTSSPSKKSSKKKKVHHENGSTSDNEEQEEEENEPIDISSRTIADIIDNYRGTEISTTQKEIYRLAALKRKATLDRKRGRLSTPEITTTTVPQKPVNDDQEKKPKVYDPEKNKTAIQMRVVNGEIVIDQQSTLIDHIDTTDEALPMLKYDENNHITSASFKPKLKPLKWTKDETELFYQVINIFIYNFFFFF